MMCLYQWNAYAALYTSHPGRYRGTVQYRTAPTAGAATAA
jgi:hypothetical protein